LTTSPARGPIVRGGLGFVKWFLDLTFGDFCCIMTSVILSSAEVIRVQDC
jgi:hypothetical protein